MLTSRGRGKPPAQLYTEAYYLGDCEGFDDFLKTRGSRLGRRLRKCLRMLAPKPGERIIDVGCGRGELSAHAAAAGAEVLAVDPSPAALRIAGDAAAPAAGGRPFRILARGEALPVRSGWADTVLLSDVVEHVRPRELRLLLGECARALRQGGRAIVHTQPNRTLVGVTVPLLCLVSPLWGVSLPRDLRREMTPGSGPAYHPGEQSRRRLRAGLRAAGFHVEEIWLEGSYAVHRIFGNGRLKEGVLRVFRRSRILRELLATQIFAVARKIECEAPVLDRRGPSP